MTGAPLPGEFALIARHFRPLAGPAALDLADDAAVFQPPPGRDLVVTADALVAGVHFLPDDPPDLIGRKLLRVNLSDLAAMGASPLGYVMTFSAPHGIADGWVAAFAAGLAQDQARFGIALLGGDTTHTPGPLTLSATVLGHVAPGRALRRDGARAGDGVWVTGTVGDGALGLLALTGRLDDPSGFLAERYRLPQPRLGLDVAAASAGMDVSDGLVQDLGHLCRASRVGAVLRAGAIPLSPAARAAGPDWLECCLTGGDDYELLLTAPPSRAQQLEAAAARAGIPLTQVGTMVAGSGVSVLDPGGQPWRLTRTGWSHF